MKKAKLIIYGVVFGMLVYLIQYLLIAYLPNVLFGLAKVLSRKPLNTVISPPKTDAKLRRVVLPNPDFVYSVIFYDVSEHDVVLTGEFPDTSQYACIGFYGNNLQPYRVINNQTGVTGSYKIRLTANNSSKLANNANRYFTVQAKTKQGSILMRLLVTDSVHLKQAAEIQRKLMIAEM
ncbi:MAG: DUF1254 domain-containing protein [Chitinophagales bacterium]|nr:DUF1254 domain-containing protein [Chitinophagales bacterium]